MDSGFPPARPAKAEPPQYAVFDDGPKKDADSLPAMPSWEDAGSKKVLLEEEDSVEMEPLKKPEKVLSELQQDKPGQMVIWRLVMPTQTHTLQMGRVTILIMTPVTGRDRRAIQTKAMAWVVRQDKDLSSNKITTTLVIMEANWAKDIRSHEPRDHMMTLHGVEHQGLMVWDLVGRLQQVLPALVLPRG
ncbi:putative fibroin-3-like protein [Eutypa lata UCREL1]|uniref:Putative fibroin-3-like protein n=1 Tax=Eutypa lata (strain UCR-EL1) TaxID=1287681 RepID=M7T6L5_EUTLA|nr:putative fibroin-3-like protein [Eutypa lata UCREL1]